MALPRPKKPTLLEPSKPTLDPSPRAPPELFQPCLDDATPTSLSTLNPATLPPSAAPKAPHGNYLNYYERRNANPDERDERLSLIPKEWIKRHRVLDVGCNAGQVTIELARDLEAAKVTGVDLDKDLTRKARANLDLSWSRQAPLKRLLVESTALSSRKRRSRSPSSASFAPLEPLPKSRSDPSPFVSTEPHYFPSSLGRMYGYLPTPKGLLSYHVEPEQHASQNGGGKTTKKGGKRTKKDWPLEIKSFPENVKLTTADWVNEEIESDREGYDVILAFSVTKWIHLQSLNAGLLTFFEKCFSTLAPGGKLILEPQPFSTYARSAKTSQPLRDHYELLKSGAQKGWRWEQGDFERVLIELVGFAKKESLGETGKMGSTFRRPVEVYTKRGGTTTVPL